MLVPITHTLPTNHSSISETLNDNTPTFKLPTQKNAHREDWTSNSIGSSFSRIAPESGETTASLKKRYFNFNVDQGALNNRLFGAWLDRTITILTSWSEDSLRLAIINSERYLMALEKSTDHRLFIASFLNALRFSANNALEFSDITSALSTFQGKEIVRADVIDLVRQLRSIGHAPSSLGN